MISGGDGATRLSDSQKDCLCCGELKRGDHPGKKMSPLTLHQAKGHHGQKGRQKSHYQPRSMQQIHVVLVALGGDIFSLTHMLFYKTIGSEFE